MDMEKLVPSYSKGPRNQRRKTTHTCGICDKSHEVRASYRLMTETEMQRIGGPYWAPIFACKEHTPFEVEVWKVKTNRSSLITKGEENEGDRK